VLVTFLAISTVYNVRVPLYEAPDEAAHARYVKSLAEDGKLPRFRSIPEYESWQPPLYYAVAAATIKALALESPPELAWNPNFPASLQNYIHTPEEAYPYSEPVLAVHSVRGLSTLFSAGTIIFICLTALVIFPERRLLAMSAAATASLVPQFAFISSTVSNDAASFFFAAAVVYFALRYWKDGVSLWLILASVAVGLGALTKLSTVIVGVVPIAAVVCQSKSQREKVARLALLAFVPLAIAGWFYVRSLIIWGAIFPDHLFWALNPLPIWDPHYRRIFLEDLRDSFWYIGGAANVRLSPIIHDALDVISVLALAGVIVSFVSSRLAGFEKRAVLLLSTLPVLALGMILYFSVAYDFQTQGRYLFVAMPAFAILLPLGLSGLFSAERDRDHPVVLALPALLLLLNLWIVAVILPRHY
jgi:4-amino-4-deoxy-L-arabinose transferase-like glycosyltransferase